MNSFGDLVLLIYPFVSLSWFKKFSPVKALVLTVICGVMFLPQDYVFELGPLEYGKSTTIALSVLLGFLLNKDRSGPGESLRYLDAPVFFMCFIIPLLSSLSNGLGLYDAFFRGFRFGMSWFVVFVFARKYLVTADDIIMTARICVGGGLVYGLLCLYEIRMSPQLSNMVYGFFPHVFIQHVRAGGYRPIVFMQHGLAVSFWMATCSILSYALWRFKIVTHIWKVPIFPAMLFLVIVTVITRSMGPTVLMLFGIFLVHISLKRKSIWYLSLLILFIPVYIYARVSGSVDTQIVNEYLMDVINYERLQSLLYRLQMEDVMFGAIHRRPFLGWGWISRGFVTEFEVFGLLVFDSFFIITALTSGFFGLIAMYLTVLTGCLLLIRLFKNSVKHYIDKEREALFIASAFTVVLILFAIDMLLNSMISQIYILFMGLLSGYSQSELKKNKVIEQ